MNRRSSQRYGIESERETCSPVMSLAAGTYPKPSVRSIAVTFMNLPGDLLPQIAKLHVLSISVTASSRLRSAPSTTLAWIDHGSGHETDPAHGTERLVQARVVGVSDHHPQFTESATLDRSRCAYPSRLARCVWSLRGTDHEVRSIDHAARDRLGSAPFL
uniref:Uncharacterized protein n=1 Tax=Physcomitrium patens TaxID=3218 RepID=A0A2K1ID77_PHYPA|nr:hypothetical protein PHYPA_029383 [Physcomitrium patens]